MEDELSFWQRIARGYRPGYDRPDDSDEDGWPSLAYNRYSGHPRQYYIQLTLW